jgi:hypothetical protein
LREEMTIQAKGSMKARATTMRRAWRATDAAVRRRERRRGRVVVEPCEGAEPGRLAEGVEPVELGEPGRLAGSAEPVEVGDVRDVEEPLGPVELGEPGRPAGCAEPDMFGGLMEALEVDWPLVSASAISDAP